MDNEYQYFTMEGVEVIVQYGTLQYTRKGRISYEENLSDGNPVFHNAGYSKGLSDGENIGYNKGYSAGKSAGYSSGYNKGYAAGLKAGSKK